MKAFYGAGIKFGIDIGSFRIRICSGENIILEEASCAAVDDETGEIAGFGTDALIRIHSAQTGNCHLVWTIKNGIMTDYEITKEMLRYFINKATKKSVSRPNVMISIPCGLGSVVKHALIDAARHAGVQNVSLIASPAAAAIWRTTPCSCSSISMTCRYFCCETVSIISHPMQSSCAHSLFEHVHHAAASVTAYESPFHCTYAHPPPFENGKTDS